MRRPALAPVPVVEAGIGHNQPPEPTPYERVERRITDLYDEASLWLDGATVETQEHADGIGNLLTMIRAAEKEADEARKVEKAPHDAAAKAVQERYKPLLSKAQQAAAACKKALAPYLAKLEAEKAAAARKAHEEAEAKRLAAVEAIRAADATNLAERAAAEALLKDAKRAEAAANAASRDTATAGNTGRAVSLRTVRQARIRSLTEATRHYYTSTPDEFRDFVQSLADRDVRNGVRDIPGVEIEETKVAV